MAAAPGHRAMPSTAKTLSIAAAHQRGDADGDQHRVGALRAMRGAQPGVGDQPVEREQYGDPDEAELLADHGEDEVCLGLRQ